MRILTNPGSNLSDEASRLYAIEISPQHIVVDGREHDTRAPIPLTEVDRWVREAREFPHVVGTTAHEFAGIFSRILKEDRELVCVMTSRKIIQSHAAALTAARTVTATAAYQDAAIDVVDSMMTDAGTGLLTIVAGEAARAGLGLRRTVSVLETMVPRARFAFIPATLDALVKGGRASWVRSWLAGVLKVKPVIAFVDGELKSVGKISAKEDAARALARDAVRAFGAGRKVWVAIFHGAVPLEARSLATALRQELDVRYLYERPLSPSIYLYSGPGALGCAVIPVDDLPWEPSVPPAL